MKKYLFVILVMFIALTSCSKDKTFTVEEKDGVKYFSNKGVPSELEFDPDLKLSVKISGTESDDDAKERIFSRVADLVVDSEQSIYIADSHSSTIKKFDKNGKFIKSFGGLGNGPGEYQMLGDMSIFNDTIVVFDQASIKRVKYDTDGKFLGFKHFQQDAKPMFMEQVNKERSLALKMAPKMVDGIVYFTVEVQMYDSKYNEIFSIDKRSMELDTNNPQINPIDIFTPFSFSDKNIFTAEVDENIFKYKVYDLSGKLEQIVKMSYKKSEVSKDRIELFKGAVRNSDGTNENDLKRAYNKAIEDIYCDKLDRVWVKKSKTDESAAGGYTEFSIFKDGVYLNKYKFKGDIIFNEILIMKDIFFFVGDKLYVALDNDGEVSVNVYEYN
ncbi:MAG: 6-bladed beta-propeller [Candidatus Delongbacteria bacterium]|nr:6-bladed beta-propeller [Candidatus Delongbacteria bacterium]